MNKSHRSILHQNRHAETRMPWGRLLFALVCCLLIGSGNLRAKAAESPVSETSIPILGLTESKVAPEVAREMEHLDPRADGWVTEVINDATGIQFKQMNKAMHAGNRALQEHLADMINDSFSGDALRPSPQALSFDDGTLKVWRHRRNQPSDAPKAFQNQSGFTQALIQLTSPINVSDNSPFLHFDMHFKTVRVAVDQVTSTTVVIVESHGHGNGVTLQQHATWECTWVQAKKPGGLPLLTELRVLDYEEVTSPHRNTPWFADCTASVMGWTPDSEDPLLRGIDHWRKHLDWRFTLDVTGPHGLAVGDVNGDGLEDLYVCEPGGLPNRLLMQNKDGTVLDASAEAGLDYLEPTASALLVDLDNDLDLDLVMASGRHVLFFANDGTGHFERRTQFSSNSIIRSISAIDYDVDGLLDVFLCGYYDRSGDRLGLGRPMPYHDANNGVQNFLLRNRRWQFDDVTTETGLNQNNQRFSYAASWEDFDNDGDPDLYVANDFGRNNLYRNDGGHFTDIAAQAGVEDLSAGMSVSWGDFNRDGWMDLYVGNMFSSAGNRIAFQRRYRDGQDASGFQRHARGNSLFSNQGDGTFLDVSEEAGVTLGRWAWSSNFVDFNNDGWEDLIVANGMVTGTPDTGDL
ncbi:MAG: FG-GAP repeat domain-containing protein [Verrucomicrobiota bacterium]